MIYEVGLLAGALLVDFLAGFQGLVTFVVLLLPYRMVLQDRNLYLTLLVCLGLSLLLEVWLVYPLGSFGFGAGLAVMGFWWAGGPVQWVRRKLRVVGWWIFGGLVTLFAYGLSFVLTGELPVIRPFGLLLTLVLGSLVVWFESSESYRGSLWGSGR